MTLLIACISSLKSIRFSFHQVKSGPFFPLEVSANPNNQQLRFPQGFPKAYPDTPIAGDKVKLECIAFGYPVSTYNWTRKNNRLPALATISSNGRVLVLNRIKVEDEGEYVCTATNEKVSITGSVILNIQAR